MYCILLTIFYNNFVTKRGKTKENQGQEQCPSAGRARPLRFWQATVLAGVIAAGARFGEIAIVPMAEDSLHTQTQQEQAISAIANRVVEQVNGEEAAFKVRCLSGYKKETDHNGSALGFGPFNFVRLDQQVCDTLSSILEDPNQKSTHEWRLQVQWAVRVTAHEIGHLVVPPKTPKEMWARESLASCHEVQLSGALAEALGMDALTANGVAVAIAQFERSPRYQPSEECVPGGKYDLGIPRLPVASYGGGGYFPLRPGG